MGRTTARHSTSPTTDPWWSAAIVNSLTIGGGPGSATLALTNGGALTVNQGLSLESNASLQQTNGALTVLGSVDVNGSLTVGSLLQADGGLIHADGPDTLVITDFRGNKAGGELRVEDYAGLSLSPLGEDLKAIPNDGTILLLGENAGLLGNEIDNMGTTSGLGRVSNPVTNSGTIRASGGRLTFCCLGGVEPAASSTAAAASENVGLMEVLQDATLLVTQGLGDNDGSIVLRGGTFDNNHRPLYNSGYITGYGTLRSGLLRNALHIGVGGGDLSVVAPVYNTGNVRTESGSTTIFFQDVTVHLGGFTGTGTVMFLAGYTEYMGAAHTVSFGGDAVFGSTAEVLIELAGPDHDQLDVAGDVYLDGTLEPVILDKLVMPCRQQRAIITTHEGTIHGGFSDGPSPGDYLDYGVFYRGAEKTAHAYNLVVFQAVEGDTDADGDVDPSDLSMLVQNWAPAGTEKVWRQGNFDDYQDGNVDPSDLSALVQNWAPAGYLPEGAPPAAGSAAVPEPGTFVLLAIGLLGLLLWRRWRMSAA